MNWTEKRELVRVAKLYYFKGHTQAEIASQIGVSRPAISKLLQKAKDSGVVEIIIKDEMANTVELEQQLEKTFSLKEVIVVPVDDHANEEMTKQMVAKAAAGYIAGNIKDVKKIGISWGETLFHVVNEFPYEKYADITVLPLVGGIGRQRIEIHSNQLAYQLSQKIGGKYEFLYAPALVESSSLKNQLLDSTDIRSLLNEIKRVELAIVGIGNPYDSTIAEMGYLKHEDLLELKKNKAIGDINSRFINRDGEEIPSPINNRVIGIEISDLRNIPSVVAVASGIKKAEAIESALKGNCFTSLIIDEPTAHRILYSLS
ncbi:sugar-binding transcriptional regulator [Ammoniphilus sp. 3BR4]|uniref:sugar-binding transcriptional regulator n=1 Tax=Ammoniphilus sp. 3BR4 TaxID=3158265 RepID=UPI0034666542